MPIAYRGKRSASPERKIFMGFIRRQEERLTQDLKNEFSQDRDIVGFPNNYKR